MPIKCLASVTTSTSFLQVPFVETFNPKSGTILLITSTVLMQQLTRSIGHQLLWIVKLGGIDESDARERDSSFSGGVPNTGRQHHHQHSHGFRHFRQLIQLRHRFNQSPRRNRTSIQCVSCSCRNYKKTTRVDSPDRTERLRRRAPTDRCTAGEWGS